MDKKAMITEIIKFGDKYFTYGDIVKVIVQYSDGARYTHIGRIRYYANNGVQSYLKLDTSERFCQDETTLDINTIVGIEHYPERVMEE